MEEQQNETIIQLYHRGSKMNINGKQIYKNDIKEWIKEFPFMGKNAFLNSIKDFKISNNLKILLIERFIIELQGELEKLKEKK